MHDETGGLPEKLTIYGPQASIGWEFRADQHGGDDANGAQRS
jgi:hypothetical protein